MADKRERGGQPLSWMDQWIANKEQIHRLTEAQTALRQEQDRRLTKLMDRIDLWHDSSPLPKPVNKEYFLEAREDDDQTVFLSVRFQDRERRSHLEAVTYQLFISEYLIEAPLDRGKSTYPIPSVSNFRGSTAFTLQEEYTAWTGENYTLYEPLKVTDSPEMMIGHTQVATMRLAPPQERETAYGRYTVIPITTDGKPESVLVCKLGPSVKRIDPLATGERMVRLLESAKYVGYLDERLGLIVPPQPKT